MIDLGKWALNNKALVLFVVVVLLLGGVYSYNEMSKLEDPEIKVKTALVITTYPGASAHQVELEVTDLLEKSIQSMENIETVSSRSMNDVSMITVEVSRLVSDDDVEQQWDILRRKMNDVSRSLPEGCSQPLVKDDFGEVFGMFYTITSDGIEYQELADYAEMAKREIKNIEGVSNINIFGERKACINIELYQDRMANMGVHPAEVISTLNGQNQTTYSGYYETGDYRLKVVVSDKYKNVDDIKSLLIQGHEDDQLHLGDIAMVSTGYEEPALNQMRYDGQEALGFSISAKSGEDIVKIGKKVEKKIKELKQTKIPLRIEYHKVFFQPERVSYSLNTFLTNLIMSLCIVIVILMFTMGFRSGVIIGANLLIIVFGSFFILGALDGTLQRVSLATFVLAMGMLVDNAIVILDGILVDLRQGKARKEAMTAIGKKTAIPLFGATLIAILAFFPIFLSPDTAGVYIRDLFIVLAVSLLLSWVMALTFTPIMAEKYLKVRKNKEDKDPFDTKYYKRLRKILIWILRHKTVTIASTVLLLAISGYCYRFLPQGFFPDMSYDQLYIEYKLNDGVNNTKVKADLQEIEKYLLLKDQITHVTTSLGGTPSRYNLVRSIADPSLSYGELIVDFVSQKSLVKSIEEIQTYLTNTYPEAYVRVKRYNLMYKKYPIEVQFSGPDPAVLKGLTAQAEAIMKSNPNTMLVCNNWEEQTPILMVDYNQPVARAAGLSRQDVSLSLLTSTGGIPTGVFYDGNHRQTIYIKSIDINGESIESLENIPVFNMIPSIKGLNKETIQGLMTGALTEEDILSATLQTIPLGQASNGVKMKWEDPLVIRYNGQRSMSAQCNPAFGVETETARLSLMKEIESIPLPTGYSMMWQGEYKASNDSEMYLFKFFPLAIILMFGILILLFKDYRKPLLIFCCIPLILIGVIFSMLITGKVFGFVAIVGILGLIGMMIKNGVVLVDEINLQLSQGVEPMKALLDSSSSRFRPVVMASLTTILGMIPLINDDLFGSLAVAIMGGLFIGTLIVLLFIPVLYALFFKIKVK